MISDRELRAELLKEYGYDINEDNELFPFVKILYETRMTSENGMKGIGEALREQKIVLYSFKKPWNAFMHGFGQWGIASFTALIVLSVFWSSYSEKMDTQNMLLERNGLVSSFLDYSARHSAKSLKEMQDLYNNDKGNKLKIKFFPSDTVVVVGK